MSRLYKAKYALMSKDSGKEQVHPGSWSLTSLYKSKKYYNASGC